MNIIVSMDSRGGIGRNGKIPWDLLDLHPRLEYLTTKVHDPGKKNAVLMGRKVWESYPEDMRPLEDRLNVVLSETVATSSFLSFFFLLCF